MIEMSATIPAWVVYTSLGFLVVRVILDAIEAYFAWLLRKASK